MQCSVIVYVYYQCDFLINSSVGVIINPSYNITVYINIYLLLLYIKCEHSISGYSVL